MKLSKEKLIELFKSGDFTIIYWDNEAPSIYKGKWDKDEEYERDNYKRLNKHEIDFQDFGSMGYCSDLVALLVESLGGNADSI